MNPTSSKIVYAFLIFLCFHNVVQAQDDLFALLEKSAPDVPNYTQATFKANRLLITQSVETRRKNTLEINVITKYWNTPEQTTNSFGADRVNTRFGIDYSFSDRFTAGFGVGTFDGTFNLLGKYRLVRQRADKKGAGIGITLVQSSSYLTRSFNHVILPEDSSERFSFASQVIFAKKVDRNLSLQITPTYVHRTSQQFEPDGDDNNHFAVGFGARYKLGGHVSIASEYYYVANRVDGIHAFDPFAIGVNWEVSDLILQFSLTNTRSFDEPTNITLTTQNFNFRDGNLHIGVSGTYVLHFNNKKKRSAKKLRKQQKKASE